MACVLKELGLGPQYEGISSSLNYYRTFSSNGEVVAVDDLRDWPDRYGAALSGVYRRDLSGMLLAGLGPQRLQLGRQVVRIEQTNKVKCWFANGETAEGDLLIGADGIHSAVRTSLYGSQEFTSERLVRWRGLFELAKVDVDPFSEVEFWGAEGHLGYLPVGRGWAYWFAAASGVTDDPEAMRAYFGDWRGSPVPALVEATDPTTIIRNEIRDFVTPLTQWSTGRVTLVGDAAHPMLPGMAQGANQAFEDVKALKIALTSFDDLERALQAYEEERLPWVAQVVRHSRSLFDFEEQHGLVSGHQNPLLACYDRIVERKQG